MSEISRIHNSLFANYAHGKMSKEAISQQAQAILSESLETENPLHELIRVKALLQALTEVQGGLLSYALTEAGKMHKDEREWYGVKFEVRGLAGKWDFSANPKWSEISERISNDKKELKKIEAAAKALYNSRQDLLTENSEVIPMGGAKCEYPGGETLAVSFPK